MVLRTRLLAAALAGLSLAAVPQAVASVAPSRVRHFDHVVVLTEENEDATTTFGAASPAVYLKSLRSKGVFLPNYFGTGHVSLDNYVAMVSGQPPQPATMSDCGGLSLWECVQPQSAQAGGRNLGDQLDAVHASWKSYQDGASRPCFHAPYSPTDPTPDSYQGNSTTGAKNYADRHVPFLYFDDVVGNDARCAKHLRPFTELAADLRANTLPAFSFITPDTCDDGHDNPCAGRTVGGLTTADAFLRAHVPALLAYLAKHNGLLVINFDEGSTPSNPLAVAQSSSDYLCPGCAGRGLGGRTGAILISPRLPQGKVDTTGYDHYSLLRAVEDDFGITEHLGMAASATPLPLAHR